MELNKHLCRAEQVEQFDWEVHEHSTNPLTQRSAVKLLKMREI